MNNVSWSTLNFGPLTHDEITLYVKDTEWQKLRERIIGIPLTAKYYELERWLKRSHHNRASQVQVTNYMNALKRGGLIR